MKNYQTIGSPRATKLMSLGLLAVSLLFTQCKKNEQSKSQDQAPTPKAAAKVSLTRSPTSGYLYGHGVNLQPSYYNNGNVNFGWSLMKSYTKIKTVRIEVEPDKVTQA